MSLHMKVFFTETTQRTRNLLACCLDGLLFSRYIKPVPLSDCMKEKKQNNFIVNVNAQRKRSKQTQGEKQLTQGDMQMWRNDIVHMLISMLHHLMKRSCTVLYTLYAKF